MFNRHRRRECIALLRIPKKKKKLLRERERELISYLHIARVRVVYSNNRRERNKECMGWRLQI